MGRRTLLLTLVLAATESALVGGPAPRPRLDLQPTPRNDPTPQAPSRQPGQTVSIDDPLVIQVPQRARLSRSAFFTTYGVRLGIGADDELREYSDEESMFPGRRVTRYHQYYRGVQVQGGDYVVHYRAADGTVESGIGRIISGLNLSASALLSDAEAVDACDRALARELRKASPLAARMPTTVRLLFAPQDETYRAPAYRLVKRCAMAHETGSSWRVDLDARNGSTLAITSLVDTFDIIASGTSTYNGKVSFPATHVPPVSTLRQPLVNTLNMQNTNGDLATAVDFLTQGQGFPSNTAMNAGVSVHWGFDGVTQFFQTTLGAQHCLPTPYKVYANYAFNNAGYDALQYVFLFDTVFGALDVVGHEYTHCLIDNGIAFPIVGEGGALAESFGDIMGEAMTRHVTGQLDWIHGSEIFPATGVKRNFAYPLQSMPAQPDVYGGLNWKATNASFDKGGVHYNCSVQNKWFQLLAEGASGATNSAGLTYSVTGVGFDTAVRVAYANMKEQLGNGADYNLARAGSVLAAQKLCGEFSKTYESVQNAWHGVGMFAAPYAAEDTVSPADGATNIEPWDATLLWEQETVDPNASWIVTLAKSPDLETEPEEWPATQTELVNGVPFGKLKIALAPDTTHYWTVRLKDSPKTMDCNRNVRSFTTAAKAVPTIISPLSTAGMPPSLHHPWNLMFKWNNAAPKAQGATHYKVDISLDAKFSTLLATSTVVGDVTEVEIDVRTNKLHYWRIAAGKDAGGGAIKFGKFVSSRFKTTLPKAELIAPLYETYPWPAVFEWKDLVGEAKYILEIKQDKKRWEDPGVLIEGSIPLPADVLSKELFLHADQWELFYDWRLRVIGPDPYTDEGAPAEGKVTALGHETGVEGLSPNDASCPKTDEDITFRWSVVPGAKEYTLYAEEAICPPNQACTHGGGDAIVGPLEAEDVSTEQAIEVGPELHLQGPTTHKDAIGYFWRVRATGEGGILGYAFGSQDPYMIQPPPPTPQNPVAGSDYTTTDSITFQWTTLMAHGGGFVLAIYEGGGCSDAPMWSNVVMGAQSGATSTTVGDFDSGAHSWRVRPFIYSWENGPSPCQTPQWSQCIGFDIEQAAPAVPIAPSVPPELYGALTKVVLTPTKVADATYYELEVHADTIDGPVVGYFTPSVADLVQSSQIVLQELSGQYNADLGRYWAYATGANPLSTYFYFARACNDAGCSNWSNSSKWMEGLPWPF